MTFLHPLALFGLVAAAIPALLHLLGRREPPALPFPALRYLKEAERRSARRLRLRHLLLLILRTAVIAIIVVAAARPLIPATVGGTHAPTALVVIVDNSLSSGAMVDGRAVLEDLRAAARASIEAMQPTDRVWLMLVDGVARAGAQEALLAVVDSMQPSASRLDLVAAVANAVRLVEAEPLPGREVHVMSDFQSTALAAGAVETSGAVRVLAVRPAGVVAANRGLGVARVSDGIAVVSVGGNAGARGAPLTVRVAPSAREVGHALAVAGEEIAVPLPTGGPGWWVGEMTLEADELRADDRRVFAWRNAPPPGVVADSSVGQFVATALAVLREAGRVGVDREVTIADQPSPGACIIVPPSDPALIGQLNRALAARGVRWRFGTRGTPGDILAPDLDLLEPIPVAVRHRLLWEGEGEGVLATVNGEPWIVRVGDVVLIGSELDTAWTALPGRPQFVPFLDALVQRVARGETGVRHVEGPVGVVFEVQGVDTIAAVVSGPDLRESDLTPASASRIRAVLGADVLDGPTVGTAGFAGSRRVDAGAPLLIMALLLALTELAVAWRVP